MLSYLPSFPKEGGVMLTPQKAIRKKCIDCSADQLKEVRLCPVTNCALWPYRMGKRPPRTSSTDTAVISEAQEKDQ